MSVRRCVWHVRCLYRRMRRLGSRTGPSQVNKRKEGMSNVTLCVHFLTCLCCVGYACGTFDGQAHPSSFMAACQLSKWYIASKFTPNDKDAWGYSWGRRSLECTAKLLIYLRSSSSLDFLRNKPSSLLPVFRRFLLLSLLLLKFQFSQISNGSFLPPSRLL
jgi:hypothetical protein